MTATLVKDLTVKEFKTMIADTTKSVVDDLIEDIQALSSDKYIKSISNNLIFSLN